MLRISSCQADIAEPFCAALTEYLGNKLGLPVEYIGDITWQERERRLLCGEIQVSWICSLAYVRSKDQQQLIELLAAPVWSHARYVGRPEYYSDVVVHAASNFTTFADLRGKSWAYNEPGSHSGYNVMRYHLASLGCDAAYFGRVVVSGSHRNSLRMVLDRSVDSAAIDSTVLELEMAQDPSIAQHLRIVEVLGPSPAPPWVIHDAVPAELRRRLREVLLSMDQDVRGSQILNAGNSRRFAEVADRDYDPIRQMNEMARQIQF